MKTTFFLKKKPDIIYGKKLRRKKNRHIKHWSRQNDITYKSRFHWDKQIKRCARIVIKCELKIT